MNPTFNPFLQSIVDTIKRWLPELQSCETHPGRFDLAELKAFVTKAPAVRVAALGISGVSPVASGQRDVSLLLAAYVVTKDAPRLPRDRAAINLIDALTLLVSEPTFGPTGSGEATDIRAQNLYSSAVGKAGIQLWALSWSQKVRIGTPFDDAGGEPPPPLPSELYVSCVPEVGPEYIQSYMPVEGLEDGC